MIPITPGLYNNIMSGASLDTKDAHNGKTKEEEKREQIPCRSKQRDSQQQEHHQW
jgi:hypothetical protein